MQISDLKFLVAEENDFQRRWLVVMLTNLGIKDIIEVADGLTAMTVLQDKAKAINICIIDLNMPGMDGMEMIRHIADERLSCSIILASSLDRSLLFSAETMTKGYGVDLLGTIEKPATPEGLQQLLDLYQPVPGRKYVQTKSPSFNFADLHRGIINKEFEPFFQPKIELASGQVKGAEAFTRWRHPEFGLIGPSSFISMVEEMGEMDAFAWSVIEKSVAACVHWHQSGFPITVSINLSPSCLINAEFSDNLIDFVATQDIQAHFIVLEVKESSVNSNAPFFLENLVRLRMKGFGISVDDYGTGNSSLQHLLRVPFSEMKIDRSFVAGASINKDLELVLSSSLDVCRKLNKQSVAVGVESQQDWDFLYKLGCTYAQGYYIARPMEGDKLPIWMREWSEFF